MDLYDLQKIVKNAFEKGEVDNLKAYLADDCRYVSEYASHSYTGAEKIACRMQEIANNLSNISAYNCEIVNLEKLFFYRDIEAQYSDGECCVLCKYGIIMYQFSNTLPAAVCLSFLNTKGKICKLVLSRNKSLFPMHFYGEELDEDSPDDLPHTIKYTPRRIERDNKNYDNRLYIWRKADEFFRNFLKDNGYGVQNVETYIEDCVVYHCYKNGREYAIYFYAYGREKKTELTGELGKYLKTCSCSKNRIVLVADLNVHRLMIGNDITYRFRDYNGEDVDKVNLWEVAEVSGNPALVYYPGDDMLSRMNEFMYAFNNESIDVYEDIISRKSLILNGYDFKGNIHNSQAMVDLQDMYKEYGILRIGYTQKGEFYTRTLYLEGYGYFHFQTNGNNKIEKITTYPFDNGMYDKFIKTEIREDPEMYKHVPQLAEIKQLPATEYEPFAMKLIFENGETKKFVFSDVQDRIARVYCDGYMFSEEIWNSATIVPLTKRNCLNYPGRGQTITFLNGYTLSAHWCYMNCPDFNEPEMCDDVLYEDDAVKLTRLWKVKANSIYKDSSTGLVKTLFKGTAFNYGGVSSFISLEGKRVTNLDFDYISDFCEGMATVGIGGKGYGFINQQGQLKIPVIYEQVENFDNGKALVKREGRWLFIDKSGNEFPMKALNDGDYKVVENFRDGMCRVSTCDMGFMDLAYHSDYESFAGTWGYVDENGTEVISPQYIYAYDFEDNRAIVCKGEWTIDEKWDNSCKTGCYWTEEELWGVIDKTGKEIIPCMYDEITKFGETNDIFAVHVGGWKNGKWAIADKDGNWLTEPIFDDIGYTYKNGLFTFYADNKWCDEECLMGVYDIKQKKVLLEPQFLDVDFMDNGNFCVSVYDDALGREIEKIIDRSGKELFHSEYSSICHWNEPYEVCIYGKTSKCGLIDKDGKVILPCKEHIKWGGIMPDRGLAIASAFGREGVVDYEDNIVVQMIYYQVDGTDEPLLTVRGGERKNQLEGLVKFDGTVVVEPKYHRLAWYDENYILCSNEGTCEVWKYTEKQASKD